MHIYILFSPIPLACLSLPQLAMVSVSPCTSLRFSVLIILYRTNVLLASGNLRQPIAQSLTGVVKCVQKNIKNFQIVLKVTFRYSIMILHHNIGRVPARQWEILNQESPCRKVGTIKSGESLPDSGNDNFKTTFGLSFFIQEVKLC